jgi:hypothetical protein
MNYKRDFEGIGTLIRNFAPHKLIDTKRKEQIELMQTMDKKLQDVFDTLNAMGITEANGEMFRRLNEVMISQKQAKEDQLKILEFIQSNTDQDNRWLETISSDIDKLLIDGRLSEDIGTLKRYLSDEITRSREEVTKLLNEQDTNERLIDLSATCINSNNSLTNKITQSQALIESKLQSLNTVIKQEFGKCQTDHKTLKENQDKIFITQTDNWSKGITYISGFLKSIHEILQEKVISNF